MTKSRKKFTAEQKAAIVRQHLKGKESISSIAEEMSIQKSTLLRSSRSDDCKRNLFTRTR